MSTSLSLGFPSLQTCQTTFIICFYLLYLSPTLKMHILLFSHTKTGIIYLPSQLYCMCSLSRGFQRTLPLQFQSPTTSLSSLCYLVHLPSSLFSRFLVWLRTTAEQATKLQPQQTSGGEQHWTHILCKTHTDFCFNSRKHLCQQWYQVVIHSIVAVEFQPDWVFFLSFKQWAQR